MPEDIITKACSICLQDKPLSEFRKQASNKDGLSYACTACLKPLVAAANKKRYERKRAELIEQVKAWQREHPDKVKEYQKQYRAKLHESQ